MGKRDRGGKFDDSEDLGDEEEVPDRGKMEGKRRNTRNTRTSAKAAARTSDADMMQTPTCKEKKSSGCKQRKPNQSKFDNGYIDQFGTPPPARRSKQASAPLPSYGDTVEIPTKYLHFPDGEISDKKRFPTTTVGKPPDQELDMVEVELRVDYRLPSDRKKLALSDNDYVLPPLGEKFADDLDLSCDREDLMAVIDNHLKLRSLVTDKERDPGRTIMIRRNEYKGSRKTTASSDPLEPLPLGPMDSIAEIPLSKFEIHLKPRTPEPIQEVDDSDSSGDDDSEESSDNNSSSVEDDCDKPLSEKDEDGGDDDSSSDNSSSSESDYEEQVGATTGSGSKAGSKVGKGKQRNKKGWIENEIAYQAKYNKWERQARRLEKVYLDVLVLAKPIPIEADGRDSASASNGSAPVSRTSQPLALKTINVILKPPTVKDVSNQSYELTTLEPNVAEFEVSVGNNFKLGHLRQSIIRGAVSHGQYRGLIGCRSSIFYRPKGARTKSVTFLKDTKSLFSIMNGLLEDSDNRTGKRL